MSSSSSSSSFNDSSSSSSSSSDYNSSSSSSGWPTSSGGGGNGGGGSSSSPPSGSSSSSAVPPASSSSSNSAPTSSSSSSCYRPSVWQLAHREHGRDASEFRRDALGLHHPTAIDGVGNGPFPFTVEHAGHQTAGRMPDADQWSVSKFGVSFGLAALLQPFDRSFVQARTPVALLPHILHRRNHVNPSLPFAKLSPAAACLERSTSPVKQCPAKHLDLGGNKDFHVDAINDGAEDLGVFVRRLGRTERHGNRPISITATAAKLSVFLDDIISFSRRFLTLWKAGAAGQAVKRVMAYHCANPSSKCRSLVAGRRDRRRRDRRSDDGSCWWRRRLAVSSRSR